MPIASLFRLFDYSHAIDRRRPTRQFITLAASQNGRGRQRHPAQKPRQMALSGMPA
jgi:hypothetical protein